MQNYWRAESNEGVAIESLSKDIANYKPCGNFEDDYTELSSLFQVQKHPRLYVGLLGSKASEEAKEGRQENYYCSVRNYTLDIGTMKCLSCLLPLQLRLTEIMFYNLDMSYEAVDLFAGTLPSCVTILKVHLDYNPLDDPKIFAKFLAEDIPARTISLRGNKLGDSGAIAIAEAIAMNTWALTLNLFDNRIGDDGGRSIVDKLRYNVMLKSLSLSRNSCGDEFFASMVRMLVGSEVDEDTRADFTKYASRLIDLNKSITLGKKSKGKPDSRPLHVEEVPLLEAIITVNDAYYFKGNRILETINLSSNTITKEGAKRAIGHLARIPIAGPPPQLREVNLTRNHLNSDQGTELRHAFNNRIVI